MTVFFFLGQAPDLSWHHRIIRAKNETDVILWWRDIWGEKQFFCLSLEDLNLAVTAVEQLNDLANTTDRRGGHSVFGLYTVTNSSGQHTDQQNTDQQNTDQQYIDQQHENQTDHTESEPSKVLGFAPLWVHESGNVDEAINTYQQSNPNSKILEIVSIAPLLNALALMRAVEAGTAEPDEDL